VSIGQKKISYLDAFSSWFAFGRTAAGFHRSRNLPYAFMPAVVRNDSLDCKNYTHGPLFVVVLLRRHASRGPSPAPGDCQASANLTVALLSATVVRAADLDGFCRLRRSVSEGLQVNSRCPVCGQDLPKGIDEHVLQSRITKAAAPAIAREAERIAEKQLELATRKLEQEHDRELRRAERRADEAERRSSQEIERAHKEAEKEVKRRLLEENRAVVARLESERERDRARHQRESDQLRRTIDDLSRKLERQTSEQRGNEGEADLFAELKVAFPNDRIERVGRGMKGGDIIHRVMDRGSEIGKIVYESKNVQCWQNAFVAKARACQAQYETPYVIIVSRVFPRDSRGLCIKKNIPVVEPRLAVDLARIIRDGICEIASMRVTGTMRNEKAQRLFDYIISKEFATRFRQIQDSIDELKEQQQKEQDWHQNHWDKERDLLERVDNARRQVSSRLTSITHDGRSAKKFRVVGKASA
jgi:hypothetical protein